MIVPCPCNHQSKFIFKRARNTYKHRGGLLAFFSFPELHFAKENLSTAFRYVSSVCRYRLTRIVSASRAT